MASRRMIARKVALSKKLSLIKWHTESLYYRGIPFCDDAGRMTADPEEFRGILIPLGKGGRAVPVSTIAESIQELYEVKLIGLCECDEKRCLEYAKFDEFQTLRADRTPQIDCDSPLGMTWYDNGMTAAPSRAPAEVKLREVKLREGKGVPENDSDFVDFWGKYPRKVGKVKARTCYDRLRSEDIPAQLLLDAALAYDEECYAEKIELRFQKHPATFLGPDRCFDDYAAMKGWSK